MIEFLVFPPQFVVPQGGSQAVRFQYLGDPDIAQSIAYVIEAQGKSRWSRRASVASPRSTMWAPPLYVQLPVRAPSWSSAMSGARASSVHFRGVEKPTGEWTYSFLTLNQMQLVVFADGVFDLEPEAVNEIIANPIVPPNSLRRFEMDVSAYPDACRKSASGGSRDFAGGDAGSGHDKTSKHAIRPGG